LAFKIKEDRGLEAGGGQHRTKTKEMVLIEERSGYLQKFDEGSDFCLLRNFLLNKQVDKPTQESSLVHKTLFAIISNNISPIKDILDDFSAKSPTSESQYIYKDLMLFLFICVAKKFGLDQSWLLKFVEQRESEEEEKNSITKTFQNLLKDNLESKDNYFEIVIAYKDILGMTEESEVILNATYEKLSKKRFPFYDSDFLNLIAFKAIDLIILTKGVTIIRPYRNLREFAERFDKRIRQISAAFFYLALVIIFFIQGYIAYKYFWGDENQSQTMGKIITVLAYLGVGTIGFVRRRKVEDFFQKRIKRFFGRSDDLNEDRI
jgi:hypothetical protein